MELVRRMNCTQSCNQGRTCTCLIQTDGGASVEDGMPTPIDAMGWVEYALLAAIVALVLVIAAIPLVV